MTAAPLILAHADGIVRPYSAVAVHRGVAYPCGQVPVRPDGSTPVDLAEQVHLVFDNLEAALSRAGASLASLLQVAVYLADLAEFDDYNQAYLDRMSHRPLPPRTTIQVAGLRGAKRIEVAAIAAVTDSCPPTASSGSLFSH